MIETQRVRTYSWDDPSVSVAAMAHRSGLEILDSTDGGPFGSEGTVEFRAHYSDGGRRGELHERSRFLRHDNTWTYVDGT